MLTNAVGSIAVETFFKDRPMQVGGLTLPFELSGRPRAIKALVAVPYGPPFELSATDELSLLVIQL